MRSSVVRAIILRTMHHGMLIREHTIAKGVEICDFWVLGAEERVD